MPLKFQKIVLTQLNALVNFVHLGVVQQTVKTFARPIVGNDLPLVPSASQTYASASNSCKRVDYQLGLSAFTSNPFANRSRWSEPPRLFVQFNPLVETLKQSVALNPRTVNIRVSELILSSLLARLAQLFFQSRRIRSQPDRRNLHQKMAVVNAERK